MNSFQFIAKPEGKLNLPKAMVGNNYFVEGWFVEVKKQRADLLPRLIKESLKVFLCLFVFSLHFCGFMCFTL